MKVEVKTLTVSQKTYGQKNLGWNIAEPFENPVRTFEVPSVRIETESFSSNQQSKKVKILVPYKPKKWPTVTPPETPFLRLPFKPLLRPRRPNQSRRSYEAAVLRYEGKLLRYEAVCFVKRQQFANRVAKYKLRMDKYDAWIKKLKFGVEKTFAVQTVTQKDLPWHPYVRNISVSLPLRGNFRSSQTNYVGNPSRPLTQIVYIVGFLENYFRGPPNLSSPLITEMVTKATSAANSRATRKLQDAIGAQSVHIGNIIAERQQTLSMLEDLFKRVLRAVATFSWKSVARSTVEALSIHRNKVAANQLLQYFFGIKPLLQDIHDGVETLRREEGDSLIEVKARATNSDEKMIIDSYRYDNPFTTGAYVTEDDHIRVQVRVKVSYTLQFEVSSGLASTLQQLGLVNPAEILWEKMPWSFVIDWILPIGGWLRSFTSQIGLTYKRGSKVTTTSVLILVSRKFEERDPSSRVENNGDWEALDHKITKVREILAVSPKFDFPAFKNPFSVTHVIESLSLIRQQIR